ncbi:hypothetical protein [Verrucosispora sp. TAA-831]|uniref:hypothetical protein n=1 Tax=Verrucosispora sp. TAA-831 TaxID=3422227 RepID=UPI003D70067A
MHSIAEDGLPDMDNLTGRVAFLFDGSIVSGWPLRTNPDDRNTPYSGFWEADGDVGRNVKFANVTHWVEFPEPVWEVEKR